mgnify:CR=1 FL=1
MEIPYKEFAYGGGLWVKCYKCAVEFDIALLAPASLARNPDNVPKPRWLLFLANTHDGSIVPGEMVRLAEVLVVASSGCWSNIEGGLFLEIDDHEVELMIARIRRLYDAPTP